MSGSRPVRPVRPGMQQGYVPPPGSAPVFPGGGGPQQSAFTAGAPANSLGAAPGLNPAAIQQQLAQSRMAAAPPMAGGPGMQGMPMRPPMPPQGMPRPDAATVDSLALYLENSLDRATAAKPNPGHSSMHRLNRAEYANTIHDLLALDHTLPPRIKPAERLFVAGIRGSEAVRKIGAGQSGARRALLARSLHARQVIRAARTAAFDNPFGDFAYSNMKRMGLGHASLCHIAKTY